MKLNVVFLIQGKGENAYVADVFFQFITYG